MDVHVSMAGNPVHMGHMQMIALAVNRLKKEKYHINKVKIFMSEGYLRDKVFYCNKSTFINRHKDMNRHKEMYRVLIPRDKRIKFLRAAVLQAKNEGVLDQNLAIDYSEDTKPSQVKVFNVWGADFAEEKPDFCGEHGPHKHAVIVARQNTPIKIAEVNTSRYSRLIVENPHETSDYSSSKIQNGDYELLPPDVREEFKKLHEVAQSAVPEELKKLDEVAQPAVPEELKKLNKRVEPQPTDTKDDPKDLVAEALQTRRSETEKIEHPIAKETGRATTEGFYTSPSGKIVHLSSGEKLLQESRVIPNAILTDPVSPRYEDQRIVVVNRDCLLAAQDEVKNEAKVAVLMFASPKEPGGGMEGKENGQEEDLCRRSDIFGFMWDQSRFLATKRMYVLVDVGDTSDSVLHPKYDTKTSNQMIHVPNVTVFRAGKDDGYSLLEHPFEVGMLISPALVKPKYERGHDGISYVEDEDIKQLNKVITTQLKASYDENYDTIILGAFGCGAFKNPPDLVAKFYKEIISKHFNGAFKKIVFAILDDAHTGDHNPEGNLKPFQKCFE